MKCILLVEDDIMIRSIFGRILAEAGYRVVQVGDAMDALASVSGADPAFDLVITDNRLPGLSGHAMIARLRRDHPTLPVICVTGRIPDDLANPASDPLVRWLLKPILPDELLNAVRGAIGAA